MIFATIALCGCSKTEPPGPPAIGRLVSYTPPPEPDPAVLPLEKTDAGATILASNLQVQLLWNKPAPGPMTALARCSGWVSGCLSPERSLDDCARSAPACATAEPWNEASACCPAACFTRYAALRTGSTGDREAFLAVYLSTTDSCIPGLAAVVRGQP